MSFVGIQQTINLYSMQQAYLTNELTDILMRITSASGKTTDLLEATNAKKCDVNNTYSSESTQYQVEMEKIEDEYNLQLAKITEWESELEVQKQNLETEIQVTTSYKESFTSALKQNVQKDFKYAQK